MIKASITKEQFEEMIDDVVLSAKDVAEAYHGTYRLQKATEDLKKARKKLEASFSEVAETEDALLVEIDGLIEKLNKVSGRDFEMFDMQLTGSGRTHS